jgi:hypothetical protein
MKRMPMVDCFHVVAIYSQKESLEFPVASQAIDIEPYGLRRRVLKNDAPGCRWVHGRMQKDLSCNYMSATN